MIERTGGALRVRLYPPLALYLLSALIGALIAFDHTAAWFRLGLIVAGVALFILFAHAPEHARLAGGKELPLLRLGLALFPALLATYFLLTTDWATRTAKDIWFSPILRIPATLFPSLHSFSLNPNVVGGVLAAFIPLQIAALSWSRKGWLLWSSVILLGLSVSGLILSELRGAWLALVVVGLAWALWVLCGVLARRWRGEGQNRTRLVFWIVLLGLLGLVTVVAIVGSPLGSFLLGIRSDRWEVWHNSLDLASDYPLTGIGLGGFEMAYSSYVMLLHVGHTAHAHNLYLDLWLEQGLLGLFSFAGLIFAAISNHSSNSRWRVAGLAALGVILLHGLVDDAFVGYGGTALPLLFVPFGLMMRQPTGEIARTDSHKSIIWALVACLVASSFFLPGIRSTLFANLGALAQTQAELSVYEQSEWPIQDQVRRSSTSSLGPAVGFYQIALTIDPTNATANRRLGQIELSLGQYEAAQKHLLSAFTSAPDQRATRQMLSETYAISGDIGRAATLWQSIDMSEGQLEIREWWYEHIGEQENAEVIKKASVCCAR